MQESQEIDGIDVKILTELQVNARASVAEISTKLNIPHSTIALRIKRLENKEIIKGYHVELNREKLGLAITAIGTLKVKPSNRSFDLVIKEYEKITGLSNLYSVAGENSGVFTLVCKDLKDLNDKIMKLRNIPEIVETQTMIVLDSIWENKQIPIQI